MALCCPVQAGVLQRAGGVIASGAKAAWCRRRARRTMALHMTHGGPHACYRPILPVLPSSDRVPRAATAAAVSAGHLKDALRTLGRLRMAALSATAHALVAQRPLKGSRAQRRPISAELGQPGGRRGDGAPRGPAPPLAQAAHQQQAQVGLGTRVDQGFGGALHAPVPPPPPLTDLPADRRRPHPRRRRQRHLPGKCRRPRRRRLHATSAGARRPPARRLTCPPRPAPAAAGCRR